MAVVVHLLFSAYVAEGEIMWSIDHIDNPSRPSVFDHKTGDMICRVYIEIKDAPYNAIIWQQVVARARQEVAEYAKTL